MGTKHQALSTEQWALTTVSAGHWAARFQLRAFPLARHCPSANFRPPPPASSLPPAALPPLVLAHRQRFPLLLFRRKEASPQPLFLLASKQSREPPVRRALNMPNARTCAMLPASATFLQSVWAEAEAEHWRRLFGASNAFRERLCPRKALECQKGSLGSKWRPAYGS